jgi:prephenate dehydrogenase
MNLAAASGGGEQKLLALGAGGFRDMTRLAASAPRIWLDICRENAGAIAATLRQLAGDLTEVAGWVEGSDEAALARSFAAAREARDTLPGKAVAGEMFDVRLAVPDRPGVLAEVTTSVGSLGVNIEDLEIAHSAEGGRGVLHLTIVGEIQAGRVAETLRDRGYDIKVSQR